MCYYVKRYNYILYENQENPFIIYISVHDRPA